jgi:hypothetical protein
VADMSVSYQCQGCSQTVTIVDGAVKRSCIFSEDCHEPIAASVSATCYNVSYLGSLPPEELKRMGM